MMQERDSYNFTEYLEFIFNFKQRLIQSQLQINVLVTCAMYFDEKYGSGWTLIIYSVSFLIANVCFCYCVARLYTIIS